MPRSPPKVGLVPLGLVNVDVHRVAVLVSDGRHPLNNGNTSNRVGRMLFECHFCPTLCVNCFSRRNQIVRTCCGDEEGGSQLLLHKHVTKQNVCRLKFKSEVFITRFSSCLSDDCSCFFSKVSRRCCQHTLCLGKKGQNQLRVGKGQRNAFRCKELVQMAAPAWL